MVKTVFVYMSKHISVSCLVVNHIYKLVKYLCCTIQIFSVCAFSAVMHGSLPLAIDCISVAAHVSVTNKAILLLL